MPFSDRDVDGTTATSRADLSLLLTLFLLSELWMGRDPNADGSEIFGFAQGALRSWERIGGDVSGPGTPFETGIAPLLAELRALIDRNEPLLARMARPLTPTA